MSQPALCGDGSASASANGNKRDTVTVSGALQALVQSLGATDWAVPCGTSRVCNKEMKTPDQLMTYTSRNFGGGHILAE